MFVGGAIGGAEPAVTGAIRNAATSTGTSFEYLLATAKVESGFNAKASAKTSSAGGLFQFIDRTWLATLKHAGPSLGYGKYASAIVQDSNGQYSVPDPQARQKIFALRNDPAANAAMAGAFTSSNSARLAGKLGRSATESELYMAHFLGANGASKLISLASQKPNASAADAFPRAAQANRSIFFDTQGKARSAADVYAALSGRYDIARANIGTAIAAATPATATRTVTAAGSANTVTPLSNVIAAATANKVTAYSTQTAGAVAAASRPAFHNLFSNDNRSGAVSGVVRELWTTRPHVAAALSGVEAPGTRQTVPPTQTVNTVSPITPMQRIQNLFNDLLSSRSS
ncbi:MAG TPA: transglycosylase SLT domain-containing protein [Xanthobacteraceae bacterium]|nr:transglycosylase SLT domain-containing protein [Xanthobacteraceae bacterium]